MKNETRELLGFNVTVVGIAETLAEAITASGSEEAVLKDSNNNVLAHSHFTVLRRVIVSTLEKATGVKRLTNEKGKVVEKDAEYIARLEDQLGESTLRGFGPMIDAETQKIPVDYTPGTRGSGGSAEPAKKWLAMFDMLVAEDKLAAFSEKYSIDVTTGSEEEVKIRVAQALKKIVTEKEQAAAKAALDL